MKLTGIRVIDLSNFLPGPYLTLQLADHGAEVIKVEQPGEGDPGRHIGLADGEHTVFFRNLNRGKKSIALDLKTEAGRAQLLSLADSADVFVESFRPGVVQRLGIGEEVLRTRNPRLIYCSISAFGQTGPYRQRPAHDLAIEAIAGALSLNVDRDGRPTIPGLPLADLLAGLQGLAGVLMALLRRQETGRGDYVDISMMDAVVSALRNVVGPTFAEGRQPDPRLERTTGGSAFYRIYETRDGKGIVLAGQEPKFVRALLEALGRADLVPLCLQGPGAHQRPVVEFLEGVFRAHPLDEWERRLEALDLCFGRVNTLPEAFEDPHLLARGMLVRDAAGRPHIGSPIRFLEEPASYSLDTPALDAHASMLRDLG
jgi:crotonobetainyl-CoA:carnitine CoA-transferase CaiB-like acyl-CoA transferase